MASDIICLTLFIFLINTCYVSFFKHILSHILNQPQHPGPHGSVGSNSASLPPDLGSVPAAGTLICLCLFCCFALCALQVAAIRNLWLAGDVARGRVSTLVVGG